MDHVNNDQLTQFNWFHSISFPSESIASTSNIVAKRRKAKGWEEENVCEMFINAVLKIL